MSGDNVFFLAALGTLIPIIAIAGGMIIAGFSLYQKARMREMAHRERLAMIEKGIVPPPESDPAAFEAADRALGPARSYRSSRSRSTGVILIGLGLGLAVLIGFAGEEPGAGIGVGGAVALLGLAFVVNSFLNGHVPQRDSSPTPPPPSGPVSPMQ